MKVAPGATFEAVATFDSGLTGTVGVRIRDNQGADFLARTTAGITADVTVGTRTVYRRNFTAPTVQGTFTLVWDDGATIITEDLEVTNNLLEPAAPSGRDLCTLADVTSIVPGYRGDTATDTTLQRFITSESELIPSEAGREIIGPAGLVARTFPIDERAYLYGRVDIGDLATLVDATVEILNPAGTSISTVAGEDVIAMYREREFQKQPWEPITALRFRPGVTLGWRTILRVTGTWGFPSIPPFVREATAKRVILRYVSDVASSGTDFADSLDNLNLAAMFASARDAIEELRSTTVLVG